MSSGVHGRRVIYIKRVLVWGVKFIDESQPEGRKRRRAGAAAAADSDDDMGCGLPAAAAAPSAASVAASRSPGRGGGAAAKAPAAVSGVPAVPSLHHQERVGPEQKGVEEV